MPEPRGALVVAVTGGIGAGKTSFCRALAGFPGVVVLEADALAHRALAENDGVRRAVRARFGASVFDETGAIDRARLAAVVFGDAREREALEAIVHPVVRAELAARVADLRRAPGVAIVLVEIPLLAEVGVPAWCERVVTVEADPATRLARAGAAGRDRDAVSRRMAAQADEAARRAIAQAVVVNEGDREELERAARRLYDRWRAEAGGA
jgi:dephospho-CoA kinase